MLGGLRARLDDDPILVVPSFQDVEHAQRELAERGAVFGALVLRFEWLYREIAAPRGHRRAGWPPRCSASCCSRPPSTRADLSVLAESAAQPGFVRAAARFVAELGAPGWTPAASPRRCGRGPATGPGARYADEVAAIYGGYRRALEQAGLVDPELFAWRALDAPAARARPLGRHAGVRVRLRRLHRARARRPRDAGRPLRRVRVRVAPVRAGQGGVPGHGGGARAPVRDRHRAHASWPRWTTTTRPARVPRSIRWSAACSRAIRRRRWRPATRSPSTRPAAREPRWSWRRRGCSTCSAAAPRPATWRWCSAIPRATRRSWSRCSGPTACPTRSTARFPFAHTGLGRGLLALIRCARASGTRRRPPRLPAHSRAS